MKLRLMLLLLLIASPVMADKYFVVVGRTTMTAAGKQQILKNIKEATGDAETIKSTSLWLYKPNTNITVRAVGLRADSLGIKHLKNITLNQIEARMEVGLSAEDKAKFEVLRRVVFFNNFTPAGNPE